LGDTSLLEADEVEVVAPLGAALSLLLDEKPKPNICFFCFVFFYSHIDMIFFFIQIAFMEGKKT
jgi:hypothetical protein